MIFRVAAPDRLSLALALALLSACSGAKPEGVRAKVVASAGPSAGLLPSPAATTPVTPATSSLLSGRVGLLVELSTTAASPIISNHGGGLVSDHGAGLVANNGGGILSNNGGSYRLQAETSLREAGLADAEVTIEDAAGQPVLGTNGKPLVTTTDQLGHYAFKGPLPTQAVVLRVKLWQGGELSALVASQAGARLATQPIDTASTLGAAYVLDRFVQGDQAKLDRLPAAEATKLASRLSDASKLITTKPSYARTDSVNLVTDLRAKAADLDTTLLEIHDLLFGQAQLGNGYQATSVAIYSPQGLFLDSKDTLFFGEPAFGRVRQVKADGTLGTFADVVRGQVKHNFPAVRAGVIAPDGTTYIATASLVLRLGTDGKLVTILGVGEPVPGSTPPPAGKAVSPAHLALAPDGTLYVGEGGFPPGPAPAPRLFAITSAGAVSEVPLLAPLTPGMGFTGLGCGADGSLYCAVYQPDPHQGQMLRRDAKGVVTKLAEGFDFADRSGGLVVTPGGVIDVSEAIASRITALQPDGSRQTLVDRAGTGKAAAPDLGFPADLALGHDGSLYATDQSLNQIDALRPGGKWERVVGLVPGTPPDPANLGLDGPSAAVFDDQNRLLVVEHGGHRLLRFDGNVATSLVGDGVPATTGDGGLANQARLSYPTGLAYQSPNLFIGTTGDRRLRMVDGLGLIKSLVQPVPGEENTDRPLNADQTPTLDHYPARPDAVAVGPDGSVYWSTLILHQVYRTRKDGVVELVAGKNQGVNGDVSVYMHLGPEQEATGPAREALLGAPQGLAFDSHGDLYVADSGSLLVRKITGLDTATPMISRYAGSSDLSVFTTGGGPDSGAHGGLLVPSGLAFGPDGTLYVSELGTASLALLLPGDDAAIANASAIFGSSNAYLSKVAPDGTITRLGGPGYKLFPDPQAPEGLLLPQCLAFAKDGRLAIVDPAANLVHVLPKGSF